MPRIASCMLLVILSLWAIGCARTVTQVVTYGDQMVVDVTLRGTLEIDSNRYFLVVSSNSSYKIPLPPPDNIDYELIEPGATPRQGAIADYYTNYYSTWSGYIMVEPGGYFLVKGPFVQGESTTRGFLSNPGQASTEVKCVFRLSQIFGTSVPGSIYFDFITVPWPGDAAKLPADHLTSTNAYISKVSGSTLTVADEEDSSLRPSQDILKCTVTLQ